MQNMRFRNSGKVTRDMDFKKVTKDCFYIETDDEFFRRGDFDYLFQEQDDDVIDPPSGMRSSVPLGGLGAGTVELRADGRFADWNIFNNSPATGNEKVQLSDACMGLRTRDAAGRVFASTLRTHPPTELPAIDQIEYSGAFPVSRLSFNDPGLLLQTDLYAFSELHIRKAEQSATPCALFSLVLANPTNSPIDAAFLFALPNHIEGQFQIKDGLILAKDGDGPTGGNMTLAAQGMDRVTYAASDSLPEIWEVFSAHGQLSTGLSSAAGAFGGISAEVRIEAGQTQTVTIAMAWYFPERPHLIEIIGNYYTQLYDSSMEVASKALNRLKETWDGIAEWHQACMDNTLPDWLQDSLVNSLATMYKTTIWTKDGRFRQFESFSCADIDAIHIHFARSLVYELFFPELKKNLFTMIADAQMDDGYIYEQYCRKRQPGLWKPGLLDEAFGRINGDCATVFVIGVCATQKWTNDREFTDKMWPHVKRATEWQMRRSERLGLPDHLVSTYDLSDFEKRDLVSYNAFMHMAGLLAAISLSQLYNDTAFEKRCQESLSIARETLNNHLWTGTYFRNWWTQEDKPDSTIHIDTLYGQLWSCILGLGITADPDDMREHLKVELKAADSPFGLEVLVDPEKPRDPDARSINDTVWQVGGITWSAVSIFFGADVDTSLHQAKKIVNHWRNKLKDQWNYTDLTAVWDGYPYCNSHYCRQLMFWAIPMAMIGQDYSAENRRLLLDPKVKGSYRLPFYTPEVTGVLERNEHGANRLSVGSGDLELKELVISGAVVAKDVRLSAGDVINVAG